MPRRKPAEVEEQIYKLPEYKAEVLIRYDPNFPPPFFQPAPNVVIVGKHECTPLGHRGAVADGGRAPGIIVPKEQPRGGNFGFDEMSPEFSAMRARIAAPPAPAPVITSEQLWAEAGGAPMPPGALSGVVIAKAPPRTEPAAAEEEPDA